MCCVFYLYVYYSVCYYCILNSDHLNHKFLIMKSEKVMCILLTHPHGNTDGTVHVCFIQPAVFGHAPSLRA